MGAEAEVIPLFPLTEVLVPAMPLPLRIFEPRYHQLLADLLATDDALADGTGFGVVALRRGSEAAPPDGSPDVAGIGTFAQILEVETQPDETLRVLAVGSRRFRIRTLLPHGSPYLRAEVDWLDEPEGDLVTEEVDAVRRLSTHVAQAIERLTGQPSTLTPLRDPTMLSYQVAAHVPLTPADRQELLAAPTAAQRLRLAGSLLRREARLLHSTRTIAMSPSVLRVAADPN